MFKQRETSAEMTLIAADDTNMTEICIIFLMAS